MTGFQSPNYTQVPNDLFDEQMREMEGAELKVILSIVRQTIGYHRDSVKFSIPKLMAMTGLSRNGVKDGAKKAEQRGVIERLNPKEQGSAEWGLVVTPSENDLLPGHSVTPTPSVSEGQVRLKESSKKSSKDITPDGVNPTPETSETQEPDIIDTMIHFAKIGEEKEAKGETWPHREKFPEPFWENLDAFVRLTGQRPIKSKVSDWLCTAQDWLDLGIKPDDLQKAYEQANPKKGDGFTVARPGSLTNTAGAFAGKRRASGEASYANPVDKIMAELEGKVLQ